MRCLAFLTLALALAACHKGAQPGEDPAKAQADTLSEAFTLEEILSAGELICGVVPGPETYYEYRLRPTGHQYELCESFARRLGTRLIVELAPATHAKARMLEEGTIDVALAEVDAPVSPTRNGWTCQTDELKRAVDAWWTPALDSQLTKQQQERRTTRRPRPRMLDQQKGIISAYDAAFQRHASAIGWDWRLLAAQAYQESAFDPQARSWAGAQGLMQIMPSTARTLDLHDPWDPEQSIAAACRYLSILEREFADIPDPRERRKFALAAYNAGPLHIRDAQALTRALGANHTLWNDVSQSCLRLQQPAYYTRPEVRHGYMVGSETTAYVEAILQRWADYRGAARSHAPQPRTPKSNGRIRARHTFAPDSI